MGWDGHLKDPKRFRREVLIRRVVGSKVKNDGPSMILMLAY